MDGWVKIHRKLIHSAVYRCSEAVHLWVHLLIMAQYSSRELLVGDKIIAIPKGSLLTSRDRLSEQTGIEKSKIERLLKSLKTEQQIEQQSFSKFRIISICNWDQYQEVEQQFEQQMNSKRTANEHIQEGKEGKEIKKKSKTKAQAPCELPPWVPIEAWNGYREMRVKIKKPMTEHAAKLAIEKLERLNREGHRPEDVLNQSTLHSWQGLFAIKAEYRPAAQPKSFSQMRQEETDRVLRSYAEKLENGRKEFSGGDGEAGCGFSSFANRTGDGSISRGGLVVIK